MWDRNKNKEKDEKRNECLQDTYTQFPYKILRICNIYVYLDDLEYVDPDQWELLQQCLLEDIPHIRQQLLLYKLWKQSTK